MNVVLKKGFSLIEILIAAAIFSIALLPLLPLIAQSQRNADYAESTYAAQLHAQGIMTVLRAEASAGTENLESVAVQYIGGLENPPYGYGFWYDGYSYVSKPISIKVSGGLNGLNGKLITVLVWDDKDRVRGRASGAVTE